MSVDPFVHTEGGSQGVNPYSYIMNNPMAGTDPTGYIPLIPLAIWAYTAYETANDAKNAYDSYQSGDMDGGDVAGAMASAAVENTVGKKVKLAKEGLQKIRKAFKGKGNNSTTQNSQNASNADNGSVSNGQQNTQGTNSAGEKPSDIGSQENIAKSEGRGKQVGEMINKDGSTKASDIKSKSEEVVFTPQQSENGPLKMVDEKGTPRVTIKTGSDRAPGSASPHVELKDSNGQRVNPQGDPVTRKSPENHTPIINDLDDEL